MSDEQNTLITSPLHHNPWIKAGEAVTACEASGRTGVHWNLWNPVPFPRWQFHLNTSSLKSPRNRHCSNSPRTEVSYIHMNDNSSPSIMINDSPPSPQSVITISSSSDAEEEMKQSLISQADDTDSKPFPQGTTKSSLSQSPLVPSSVHPMSSVYLQRSSPRVSNSGRCYAAPHTSSTFDAMNVSQAPSNSGEKVVCKQIPPFVVTRSGRCNSRHIESSSTTFKSPRNTSTFDMMNVCQVPSNSEKVGEKIVCKQEPLFLISSSNHCNSRHNESRPETFKSPVVCSIPITATCVLPPCFISTTNSVQPALVYPQNSSFINRGQDLCTLIPQNICLHLPRGIPPGEFNCSRCCREDSLRAVPTSIGRLHLSQKFHMTYTSNMDGPNIVPVSSNVSNSSSFHSGSYY